MNHYSAISFALSSWSLNFRTDKDDVLTGQAARIISPSLLCQCIMLLPNIFSKSFLSTALNSLSTQGLFSWDSLCIALRKHLHALLPFLFRTYREIWHYKPSRLLACPETTLKVSSGKMLLCLAEHGSQSLHSLHLVGINRAWGIIQE